MKKNWNEMSFEEKSLMVAQIEESYQNKTLFKNAADAANNVRIGYEEDPDWFDFTVTDIEAFEKEYAELIAEDFDEHVVEDVELTKAGYGHDTLAWVLDGEEQSCTGEFYVDKEGMLHHTAIAANGDEVEITIKY